jgi:hypothetical protein
MAPVALRKRRYARPQKRTRTNDGELRRRSVCYPLRPQQKVAGWHRRREEEIQAAIQQLQTQQQIAAQSAQQLAVSRQKLAHYNLAFKTCMQGRGYTLN